MAVYTKFSKVIDAEGEPLTVRDALSLINQTLDEALALLDRLDIEHDADPPSMAGALRFARTHALTTYDALYLLLARREGVALITRDSDMVRAAHEIGVRVL